MVAVASEQVPSKSGVYPSIPFSTYRKIDAINWHTLEPYRVSPKHARYRLTMPDEVTDAMKLGEAFHASILEPERFAEEFCAMPAFPGHHASTEHKEAKREWLQENRTKVPLKADEMLNCRMMAKAARENPTLNAILSGKGRNELTIVWRDKETDALCKGRVDRLCRAPAKVIYPGMDVTGDVLVALDLKSARDVLPDKFDYASQDYGYHGQMAFYVDGLNTLDPADIVPIIGAVQNAEPFDVVPYSMPDELLDAGRKLYRSLLARHLACDKAKKWPGVSERVCALSLTPKGKREVEHVG